MGWGYDPLSDDAKKFQGGIRADHFCVTSKLGGGGLAAVTGSNCF